MTDSQSQWCYNESLTITSFEKIDWVGIGKLLLAKQFWIFIHTDLVKMLDKGLFNRAPLISTKCTLTVKNYNSLNTMHFSE